MKMMLSCSLSPKMAARMDHLMRQPIRAERQRGAEEETEPVVQEEQIEKEEKEEEVEFNFNPNESGMYQNQTDEGRLRRVLTGQHIYLLKDEKHLMNLFLHIEDMLSLRQSCHFHIVFSWCFLACYPS